MHRKYVWLFLSVLTSLTLACGLASLVRQPSAPPPPPTATPVAILPTATPVPPLPTPLPPTETPVPLPPTPTNTLVLPPETPAPEPVVADTPPPPADTPPPAEEPAPAPESGQLSSQATGACFNPYYPIRSDTIWRYRMQATDAPGTEYSLTFKDITGDAFTAVQIFPEFSSEVRWNCTEQGLLSSEYANLNLNMPGAQFETLDFSGITLPPADQWQIGTSWESNYKVKAVVSVEGMTVESQFDIAMQNQIAAVESVTVPAGTYPDAMRIDMTGTMIINTAGNQMQTNFTASNWFVRDVGQVKSSSNEPDSAFVMELLSVE